MRIFTTFLFLLTIAPYLPAQTRYYVNATATGQATGLSWADAFTDLQQAVTQAQSGDEIWVAGGVYRPTADADRTISFEPASGVRLIGGFAGTETYMEDRNWTANPTVLSGDIGVVGDSTDNSYNVMYMFEPDSTTLLDGLIIRDGQADSLLLVAPYRSRLSCGGGLYVMGYAGDAYPVIRHCRFERNTARFYGGGVFINGGGTLSSVGPVFFDCTFEGNRSVSTGGGIARFGGSVIERGIDVDSCRFIGNKAYNGGGLYWEDNNGQDSIAIMRCVFDGNIAQNQGGTIKITPSRPNLSWVTIGENVFTHNIAGVSPIVDCFGNFLTIEGEVNFEKNVCTGNKSISGPLLRIEALSSDNSHLIINSNEIRNNEVSEYYYFIQAAFSGAECYYNNNIMCDNYCNTKIDEIIFSDASLLNCIANYIHKNSDGIILFSGLSGGQTFINECIFINSQFNSDNAVVAFSGLDFPDPKINNTNFFAQNNLYLFNVRSQYMGTIRVANCIIYNNPLSVNYFQGTTGGISSTFIIENTYLSQATCADLPPGSTCTNLLTNIDPLFVNPDSGDYRLQPCSPLINAGTNSVVLPGSTDIDGAPRIQGGTVDIGAYESSSLALAGAAATAPSCPQGQSGSVSVEAAHACPPLTYIWSHDPNLNQPAATGLAPGTYAVTFTDAKGESATAVAVVGTGDPLPAQAVGLPVFCGDTLGGSATATLIGGLPPLSYLWQVAPDSVVTDSQPAGLAIGSYTVTVTDAQGCTGTAVAAVDKTGGLSVDVLAVNVSCYGAADGALTVLPANGMPPFVWHWDNGSDQPAQTNLGPGQYGGALTDAFGCNIAWVLPVTQPDPLTLDAEITDATDSMAADGSIALLPTGGTQPWSAQWSPDLSGLTVEGLPAGQYQVTLTDQNGCTVAAVWTVGVTVGTDEAAGISGVWLWPNPATESVTLSWWASSSEPLELRVYDASGRVMLERSLTGQSGTNQFTINGLEQWPSGAYFWQLKGASSVGGVFVRW